MEKTAMFLIHGVTKGNNEFSKIKEYLEKKNKNLKVYLPLLPGHEICPITKQTCLQKFWLTTPKDWLDFSEKEFKKVRKKHKKIIVGGISLGGNLAISIASRYKVDGIILIGTPMFLAPVLTIGYYAANIAMFILKKKYRERSGYYHNFPLQKLLSIKLYIDKTRKEVKKVKAPLLIIHSKKDDIALPRSARYIFKNAGSRKKKLVWIPLRHGIDASSKVEAEMISNIILHFLKKYIE